LYLLGRNSHSRLPRILQCFPFIGRYLRLSKSLFENCLVVINTLGIGCKISGKTDQLSVIISDDNWAGSELFQSRETCATFRPIDWNCLPARAKHTIFCHISAFIDHAGKGNAGIDATTRPGMANCSTRVICYTFVVIEWHTNVRLNKFIKNKYTTKLTNSHLKSLYSILY